MPYTILQITENASFEIWRGGRDSTRDQLHDSAVF